LSEDGKGGTIHIIYVLTRLVLLYEFIVREVGENGQGETILIIYKNLYKTDIFCCRDLLLKKYSCEMFAYLFSPC
jgi:hypothetical protein